MLRVLFSPSDDWTAVNVSNRFLVTELSLWLIYFFLTFPTIYAARVFPPSDDWTVVNVSIWFLVTGLSLPLPSRCLFCSRFGSLFNHRNVIQRPCFLVMNYRIKKS
jgi:hypothetical protein